ncbi:MAG: glycine dehydrogenase (aminomethyl-transferring), partial [Bacteroidota bacterium]
MKLDINNTERFDSRHNGPDDQQIQEMLDMIKAGSLKELIDQTIPEFIQLKDEMDLPLAKGEHQFLMDFKQLASKNKVFKNYIGTGYYNTYVPNVILRNILENPGWYTAYTPYQAEIAQGRLEALINFQTMIIDLTGMEIANASLLDEGTAAAEAMTMLWDGRKREKKKANKFFVDINTFPQTLDVLKTRALPVGIDLVIDDLANLDLSDPELYGVFLQYPDNNGSIKDHSDFIAAAKEQQVFVAMAADIMSLLLLKSPGEMGVDVVVGTSQRFGVPMGYGGPHAAYFATKEAFKRQIPGRMIGASLDSQGNNAYRMALQTREQHIRREKATSNICTAQVLLAVMSGMYAVYHGPQGLKNIATRIHGLTKLLDKGLKDLGLGQLNENYFDSLKIEVSDKQSIKNLSEAK